MSAAAELWLINPRTEKFVCFLKLVLARNIHTSPKKSAAELLGSAHRAVTVQYTSHTHTLLLSTLSSDISKIWELALFLLSSVSLHRWRLSLRVNCTLKWTFCES